MFDLLPQFQTLVFLFSNHVGFASDEKRALTPEVGFLWYSPPPPPFLQGRQQTDSIAFVTEVSVAFAADIIRNADELCPNVSRMWQIAGNPRAHHFPTPTGALPRNGDRGTFVVLMLFFLFSFLLGLRDLRFNTLFSVWSFTQRIPEMEVQKKIPPPAQPDRLF